MRARIVLYCVSGFGDQYSNILTGFKACNDLINYGYEVEIFWLNKNVYFSPDLPLDYIYDFSLFEQINVKIKYIKSENEILDGFVFLNTNQHAIKIFVDKVNDELRNYELPIFDYWGFHRNSVGSYHPENLPSFNYQFINEDIIEIANKFVGQKTKIKSIHFRCDDVYIPEDYKTVLMDEFYNSKMEPLFEFIETNSNEEIMICSNNRSIKEYFKKNFNNVFYNEFDYDLHLHHSYNLNYDEQININHAKQIVAEMTLFSKCDKIFTVNKILSNFLTYGVAHNLYHTNWEYKIKNLISN